MSQDVFGSRLGRIHMTKQDLGKLQTRKLKGLKRKAPTEESVKTSPKQARTEEDMDV